MTPFRQSLHESYGITGKLQGLSRVAYLPVPENHTVTAYIVLDGEARGSLNCHVNSIKIHSFIKKEDTKQKRTAIIGELLEPLDDLPF